MAEELRLAGELDESVKVLQRGLEVSGVHVGLFRALGITFTAKRD